MPAALPMNEVIAAIDGMHRQDPAGAELRHARRTSHWLAQFEGEHSQATVKRIVDRTWQKMASGAQALAKAQGLI